MNEKRRVFGVAGGAVGLGGLAAALGTCCVAPGAVALLGVSGAIALARVAQYRPYILMAAAVLLGLAFYWAYRPDPACADGSCEARSRSRLRWTVWIAAAVLATLAALSFFPGY
ncbi:MAG TPA: mercuric transporter MerT family protein [Luteimonas sp.]|nr:mercuric transporter MerT family protein [Luteimonas sp.]